MLILGALLRGPSACGASAPVQKGLLSMGVYLMATLEKGTVYFVEMPDGSQSEPRTIEVDTKVKVLALVDVGWNLYQRADGEVLFVRPEDDT